MGSNHRVACKTAQLPTVLQAALAILDKLDRFSENPTIVLDFGVTKLMRIMVSLPGTPLCKGIILAFVKI